MKPCRAWPDAVLISRPPSPCLRMRAIASWQHRNTPLVFTANTLSHSASVIASIRAMVMTPAFCTEMSTRPNSFSARSYSAVTSSLLVTSMRIDATWAPAALRPAATSSTRASIALTTTAAPSSAKRFAIAAPMPPLAPVITAVLPSKRFCTFLLLPADKAAIDDQVDAGDVTRGAAGQEHGRADHLFRRRHAAHWCVALEYLDLFRDLRPFVHRRQRVAGA